MKALTTTLTLTAWLVLALASSVAACDVVVTEASISPLTSGWIDKGPDEIAAGVVAAENHPSEAVLSQLNDVREALGLMPARWDHRLDAAAQGHAHFLLAHQGLYAPHGGLSPHQQSAGLEGFTGADPIARVLAAGYGGVSAGEVIAHRSTGVAAVVSWLESLYHRLPLLLPQLDELGYGEVANADKSANVLELGMVLDRVPMSPSGAPVLYPRDGALNVPFSWDGNEVPQPLAPPAGYPSGPVFTAHYPAGAPTVVIAQVTTQDGVVLPVTIFTTDGDPNMPITDVALIPHAPLMPKATYSIRIVGDLSGVESITEWQVITRSAGCDPIAQDCGPGRGCYLQDGESVCLWEGNKDLNDTCAYTNDCAPGRACYGSRCVAMCDIRPGAEGADSCVSRCQGAALSYPQQEKIGVCLHPTCLGPTHPCGAGEGCYWSGAFICHWAGEGGQGASCDYVNDCSPGYGCLASECRRFCGGPGLPSCGAVCPDTSQQLDETSGTRVCL